MEHEGPHDRDVLRESLREMVREKRLKMELDGLRPTQSEVLDAVWNSLVRGKSEAIKQGVTEEKLEGDLFILHELIEEERGLPGPAEQRGEGEIEFLKKMAPLIRSGIAKRVRKQLQETGTCSEVRAIDEEEQNVLANVDMLQQFTPYSALEVERRKDFLRTYFKGLRNKARRY